MSKLGFHPELLPQVEGHLQTPEAASATLCSFFESGDAILAHLTPEVMLFFFLMHTRNSPSGPLGAQSFT